MSHKKAVPSPPQLRVPGLQEPVQAVEAPLPLHA
jgi:hypothetical protein